MLCTFQGASKQRWIDGLKQASLYSWDGKWNKLQRSISIEHKSPLQILWNYTLARKKCQEQPASLNLSDHSLTYKKRSKWNLKKRINLKKNYFNLKKKSCFQNVPNGTIYRGFHQDPSTLCHICWNWTLSRERTGGGLTAHTHWISLTPV